MTQESERLWRLHQIASLVFDRCAEKLRQENAARDALLRQLADLEPRPTRPGLLWPASEQAQFGYQQWASARRAVINPQLAAQTARCLQAAEESLQAFGRLQVLDALAERVLQSR